MAGGFEDTSYFVRSIKQIFDVTLAQFSPPNYCITSNRKIILDSIKDAKAKNITNINSIDRIIVKKMREEDNFGNEIK